MARDTMATEEEDDISGPLQALELQAKEERDFERMVERNTQTQQLVQQLRSPYGIVDHEERQQVYTRLADVIHGAHGSGGKHLFEFHLCSRALGQFEADDLLRQYKIYLSRAWDKLLDGKEKKFWAAHARECLRDLRHFCSSALGDFLLIQRDSNHRQFARQIREALVNYVTIIPDHLIENPNDLVRTEKKVQAIEIDGLAVRVVEESRDLVIKTFIVSETLFGHPLPTTNIVTAIPGVVSAIKRRIANSGYLNILRLRNGSVRINYDPEDTSEAGITQRLKAASRRGLVSSTKFDDHDPRETFEWLLRPLVYFNQQAFDDVPGANDREGPLFPLQQRKKYKIHDFAPCDLFLLSSNGLSEWHTNTDILQALRARVRLVEEKSVLTGTAKLVADDLSTHGDAGQWSIRCDSMGFAERLLDCFARPELCWREYWDLKEQQLYAFDCYTGKAFRLATRETSGEKHYSA